MLVCTDKRVKGQSGGGIYRSADLFLACFAYRGYRDCNKKSILLFELPRQHETALKTKTAVFIKKLFSV